MEERSRKSYIISWIALLLCLVAVIFVVEGRIRRSGAAGGKLSRSLGPEWQKLELILTQIRDNYVDSVDMAQLIDRAIPIIMQELDPHSAYLEPTSLQRADDELKGNIEGIGVLFNVVADTARVISVVPGGPSEKAGIVAGDRIITVDDRTIAGVKMASDSMVVLMKGPRGTQVTIGVQRVGEPELILFEMVRDKVPVHSVDVAYLIDSTTAYVKLAKFSRTSYLEVLQELISLRERGMQQLILDLRDNTGGYMDQALKLAGLFLDKGQLIVYTEGAHRSREEYLNPVQGPYKDLPLAVLINENSASSSEILVGALQDCDRGIILGRRSFGKGLVQEPVYFSDRSGLRLTVSRYYTPLGRSIQRPYSEGTESYAYDIIERYRRGEFMQADSIPRNDSLKYVTPMGKVLYGGGGIIPDVFVPLDTTGMNPLYVRLSRLNVPIRFAAQYADRHLKVLSQADTLPKLQAFFEATPLERDLLRYVRTQKVPVRTEEWQECKSLLLTQVKAYVGRNTPLGEQALYYYLGTIDPTLKRALEELKKTAP